MKPSLEAHLWFFAFCVIVLIGAIRATRPQK